MVWVRCRDSGKGWWSPPWLVPAGSLSRSWLEGAWKEQLPDTWSLERVAGQEPWALDKGAAGPVGPAGKKWRAYRPPSPLLSHSHLLPVPPKDQPNWRRKHKAGRWTHSTEVHLPPKAGGEGQGENGQPGESTWHNCPLTQLLRPS